MIRFRLLLSGLLVCGLAASNSIAQEPTIGRDGDFIGWATNGPAVYHVRQTGVQIQAAPPVTFFPLPTDLPPDIKRTMMMYRAMARAKVYVLKDNVFDHFLPESLNNLVYTNFIAHTNGRNMTIWNVRQHPPGWPAEPPIVQWNPNSLIWGMRGLTALSPCWEQEGNSGQVPITALTRRHGYTRGHDMGGDRVGTLYAGRRVWFVTEQNEVVQVTVKREIVRTIPGCGRDYTILLFGSDLPMSIQPMRVMSPNDVFSVPHSKYVYCPGGLCPLFQTEQMGGVSAGVPGFVLNTMKGGDSGSPNMLPLPGELVFTSGRTTSGASSEMQADMDTLCRLEGLDPARYQMQWVDLSAYPTY